MLGAGQGTVLEGVLDLPASLHIPCATSVGVETRVSRKRVTWMGPVDSAGTGFTPEGRVDQQIDLGPVRRFRLPLHHTMLELYLDGLPIQCYTLAQAPDVTLSCRGARNLRLWQWE